MTKEEYLQITSYASPEDAKKDLRTIQVLFPLALIVILLGDFVFRLAILLNNYIGFVVLIGYLGLFIFFVWKCWDVIKKTRKVTKAQLLFSIILAPLSWIWFYPQLSEPLEIIVGTRMPPTTDAVAEGQARVEARKKGSANAVRTILIVAGLVALLLIGLSVYQVMNA